MLADRQNCGFGKTADLDKNKLKPILNVFSYNTLIKALWKIPTNWEESHECCLKIDDIIEDMKCATSSVSPNTVIGCLPNVITVSHGCFTSSNFCDRLTDT